MRITSWATEMEGKFVEDYSEPFLLTPIIVLTLDTSESVGLPQPRP